jgi:uncharacterized protein YoaH (UPF0181 family)
MSRHKKSDLSLKQRHRAFERFVALEDFGISANDAAAQVAEEFRVSRAGVERLLAEAELLNWDLPPLPPPR